MIWIALLRNSSIGVPVHCLVFTLKVWFHSTNGNREIRTYSHFGNLHNRHKDVRSRQEGNSGVQTFKWLPGLPSQSTILWDRLALGIQRIARGQMKIAVSP